MEMSFLHTIISYILVKNELIKYIVLLIRWYKVQWKVYVFFIKANIKFKFIHELLHLTQAKS